MKKTNINIWSYAYITRLINDSAMSVYQLEDVTGVGHKTIRNFMRYLKRHDMAHVESWMKDRTGRTSIRKWRLGPGQDAPQSIVKKRQRIEVGRQKYETVWRHQNVN